MEKQCTTCDEWKPAEAFSKRSAAPDDLRLQCRKCRSAKQHQRYIAKRSSIIARVAAARAKNPETSRRYRIARYANDSTYRAKVAAYAKQYLRKKHAVRKAKPICAFADRIRRRLRHVLKKGGVSKPAPTFSLLGYQPAALHTHLSRYLNNPCEVCHKIVLTVATSHIDHIQPIAVAKSLEDVVRLNALTNLRLICARCNLSKQAAS